MDYEGAYSQKWTQDWCIVLLFIWDNFIPFQDECLKGLGGKNYTHLPFNCPCAYGKIYTMQLQLQRTNWFYKLQSSHSFYCWPIFFILRNSDTDTGNVLAAYLASLLNCYYVTSCTYLYLTLNPKSTCYYLSTLTQMELLSCSKQR